MRSRTRSKATEKEVRQVLITLGKELGKDVANTLESDRKRGRAGADYTRERRSDSKANLALKEVRQVLITLVKGGRTGRERSQPGADYTW